MILKIIALLLLKIVTYINQKDNCFHVYIFIDLYIFINLVILVNII